MPANGQRGELDLEVEGARYTLRLDFNSMCQLESFLGRPLDEIEAQLKLGMITPRRALVWAALQAKHAAEVKTLEDAGRWIDRADPDRVTVALRELMVLNAGADTPAPEAAAGGPRRAGGGIGAPSSGKRGATGSRRRGSGR